jgi:hypothetical protein
MKESVLFIFIFISIVTFAQSPKVEKVKHFKINQTLCSNQKGFQLVLKAIESDSRCPEGVTCIWEGEATAVVSVYKDAALIESTALVFSIKNLEDNKKWFASYVPAKKKKIKILEILPYPKSGVKINPKDYYITIGYVK